MLREKSIGKIKLERVKGSRDGFTLYEILHLRSPSSCTSPGGLAPPVRKTYSDDPALNPFVLLLTVCVGV